MVRRPYLPGRGDFVWLMFDPQTGHEQSGRRPALTLSPRRYNRKTGLAIFCPITSRVKGYPFEVALTGVGDVRGVVLSDQVKSLDWRARQTRFISSAPGRVVGEVLAKLSVLLEDG